MASATAGRPPSSWPATPRQMGYLRAVAREAELDEERVDALCRRTVGAGAARLTRAQASRMIEVIQAERNARRRG
jgi:hypothetical protein